MKSLKREREFLPAALEIVDTPPNPAGRSILWAIVGFFLLTIIWAVCGEVDIVAVARGKVVPQGYSKVIQPLEIGTVKAIRVQDGQTVAAGQILVELDDSAAAADAARWEADRVVARQEANRLRRLAEWSMHAKGLPATIPGPQLSDPLTLAQWHEHRIQPCETPSAGRGTGGGAANSSPTTGQTRGRVAADRKARQERTPASR